jgi:hypothetical protein
MLTNIIIDIVLLLLCISYVISYEYLPYRRKIIIRETL